MSYASASPLQAAVYQALTSDPAVTAMVGAAIYDQVPAGTLPSTYITLGPETATQVDDRSGRSTRHDFSISVNTDASGFLSIKDVAGAVTDALQDAALSLSNGAVSVLEFQRARARLIGNGALRQIDLRFRARVDLD